MSLAFGSQSSKPTVPVLVIDKRPANFCFPGLNNEWKGTGSGKKKGLSHIARDTGHLLQLRCVYVCNVTLNTISLPFVIGGSHQPGAMWGAAVA